MNETLVNAFKQSYGFDTKYEAAEGPYHLERLVRSEHGTPKEAGE